VKRESNNPVYILHPVKQRYGNDEKGKNDHRTKQHHSTCWQQRT